MGGLARLPFRSASPLVGQCNHFPCTRPHFRNALDCRWPNRCGVEERRQQWKIARCVAPSPEIVIEVEKPEGRRAVEQDVQPLWNSERAFRCARVTGSIALSCCLFAALHCTSVPSGRFASLAAQGTARITTAGMREAIRGGWAGLSAGTLHTLCGPDHLAGLTPLTLGKSQSIAAAMGALWGFGHSTGQMLLGLGFILLKERFHGIVPLLSKWSGTVVGCTLIAIGLVGVYESRHVEEQEDAIVESAAMAGLGGQSNAVNTLAKRRSLGTYMMGFVYGLNPDSLFVVLPALALPTTLGASMYIGMFAFGTVMAMGGYSLAIGTASEAAAKGRPLLLRNLSKMAAGVAILVGIVVLLTGFGFGLPT